MKIFSTFYAFTEDKNDPLQFFSGVDIVIQFFFLMLSSHFTARDLYGKMILNNLVINLSLICQAQDKDREDFKNCSIEPSIVLVSIPYLDKR